MKKFLLFIAAVPVVLIAGAFIFLATFNADRYRSALESGIAKALGNPVSIGHIGLEWQNGAALNVTKITVYEDASRTKSGLELGSADVQVQMMPLLQKKIVVTSVVLDKPSVDIVRDASGIKVGGISLSKKSPASPAQASSPQSPAPSFSADSIAVRGGHILFHDRSGASPTDVEIKNFDVDVKSFSMDRPFTVDASASVFSDKQNVKFSGRVTLGAPLVLENLAVTADLSQIELKKLAQSFPAVNSSGLSAVGGTFAAQCARLSMDPAGLDAAKLQATLKDGRIAAAAFGAPLEKIDAAAVLGTGEVTVDHLTASVSGGTVKFSGKVSGLKTQPVLTVQGNIDDVSIDQLIKSMRPGSPQLAGHLTMEIQGTARGLVWDSIAHTLNGTARIRMNDGVLLNYNIFKVVFDKISVIPGAADALKSHFPPAYNLLLQDQNTILKPLDLSAKIANGIFHFDSLQLQTDLVAIAGSGAIGLDRSLDVKANLVMGAQISEICVKSINILQTLCDAQGQITIPVSIAGPLPQVKIIPDTNYVTSKLLAGKTQALVQGIVSNPQEGLDSIQNLFKKVKV